MTGRVVIIQGGGGSGAWEEDALLVESQLEGGMRLVADDIRALLLG